MKISKKENISLMKIKKQKIKIILDIPKNNECFECSNLNPEFISLNNGIFLCKNCIKNHKNFPKSISKILKNDLNNLTLKNIQYLCCGGNEKLKHFIQFEFPKLKKLPFQNLYKTHALDYYRKNLEYLIEGGIKPIRPNKNKAYELLKINNNIKKIKNSNDNNNNNNNNDIIEEKITKDNTNSSNEQKIKKSRFTKSSERARSNLNIILPNFNNSLNNFNTINIYNYNDKIYTETYYKKRFFSQIFTLTNSDDNDLNNITFNKEENMHDLKLKNQKKEDKKLDTNIKIIKRKNFIDNELIKNQRNNIYEKPFFQNYINTDNKEKRIKDIQKGIEISSSELKYFSNDIRDMAQISNSNTSKNLRSSQKIFKKKTVGNSFSIYFKNHEQSSSIISQEKYQNKNNELFNKRNSDKYEIKNKFFEELEMNNSLEEKGKIKVNRQIKINKNRKRYSLSNIALDNKCNNEKIKELITEKNLKKKLNKIQKSKIIERIHRVTSIKKEKSNNSYNIGKSETEFIKIENNKNKDYTINKKNKNSLLIKDMINKPDNIKKNILEIIKSNNLSNLIITPNSKKLNHNFTESKFFNKNDFTREPILKELYKIKKDDM